ncbi:MAG: hypothetical protein V4805_12305 [Pseudomonadota bacterium]
MYKQLFYLTNHELTAYIWQKADLLRVDSFENDTAGWQRFADYLAEAQMAPSYFLVDLIEEDFQRDTVPHVRGKTRRLLIDRRLAQLYRDTPFRHAALQGRDHEGRKDDRYLFSALTNAELPKPWLEALLKHAVPLVGIYSLASLSQVLFEKLKLNTMPTLLVSHQSSGLRQSYFHEGYLRFSRLTPLADHAADLLAESFKSETAKTRQFLASMRLLGRGDQVQIVVLASADNLAVLQVGLDDTPDVTHTLIEIEEAQQLLGLGQFDCTTDCSPLYLALLAGSRIRTHYPLRDQKHFYQLLQTRIALYALSGVVAVVAAIWATIDVLNTFELRRQAAQLELEAVATEYRFQTIVKNMPATLVTPHNMKAVVDLERMIATNVPSPTVQFATISNALDSLPQIKITRLQWEAVETASLLTPADENVPLPPPGETPPSAALVGVPDKTSQIVLLEGEIEPFKQDYREAIESVNKLVESLNKNKQLHAEITKPPLDTRPSVKLENSAGEERKELKAQFALKLVWKP